MSKEQQTPSTSEKVEHVARPRHNHPEDAFWRSQFLDKIKEFDVLLRMVVLLWNVFLTVATFFSFFQIVRADSLMLLVITVISWIITLRFFFSPSAKP